MVKPGKTIGHAPCPYCSDKGAEVKHDKNGAPYLICFECTPASQHFTRGDATRIQNLLGGGKFRPIAGMELPTWAAPAAASPPAPPAPARQPAKKTTLLG